MLRITYLLLATFLSMRAAAQHGFDKPEVGKPVPDIQFDNVQYYPKKSVSLKEFRGKWLFLDFWYTGCTAAVKSLNEIDQLQKKFNDQVQFLMVCTNHKQAHAKLSFSKLTRRYGLRLPAAFDSTLYKRWDICLVPHIVIIDPQGIVYAETPGSDLTADKIQDLIAGKDPRFDQREPRLGFDITQFPGTPDSSLVFRSVLTKWNGEGGGSSNVYEHVKWSAKERNSGIVLRKCSLSDLYQSAYWGMNDPNVVRINGNLVYPRPTVEVADDGLFRENTSDNETQPRYNYNLSVPPSRGADPEFIKRIFQHELKNVFGYDITREKKRMEVYRLLAKPNAIEKLRTKGGKRKVLSSPVGLELRNIPISFFCQSIIYKLSASSRIFIDENETGYAGNIDISIDAIMTDFDDMQLALKKHGFEIVKEPAEVSVIVIRDPPNSDH